jgi:hypothetical protein
VVRGPTPVGCDGAQGEPDERRRGVVGRKLPRVLMTLRMRACTRSSVVRSHVGCPAETRRREPRPSRSGATSCQSSRPLPPRASLEGGQDLRGRVGTRRGGDRPQGGGQRLRSFQLARSKPCRIRCTRHVCRVVAG